MFSCKIVDKQEFVFIFCCELKAGGHFFGDGDENQFKCFYFIYGTGTPAIG